MSTDTTVPPEHLDPKQYLPTPAAAPDIPPRAIGLAEDILDTTFPAGEFAGARRSALAGAALYAACVALTGTGVSQDTVADATGTTAVSIRSWMHDMAERAVTEDSVDVAVVCDTNVETRAAWDRLSHLAGGGGIPELPDASAFGEE
ncbi:Transcription initiation factor IIB 3 protein [Halorhabdus tiamatea SARL4B]|uniref:Transcription initiation factor IIB 3 protein n=1 Tax=Halorhabdus tiamatea SARL4B TaxID=1033806 RepID=U2E3W5_9EURY|nr:hypothetical protein [Halorhabdus tiamatea]ERJ06641.1 Transcription initiation factor IIB 3 protein [Halorhabdus tiamatea SARL4B]